jgi:hypothetical protein
MTQKSETLDRFTGFAFVAKPVIGALFLAGLLGGSSIARAQAGPTLPERVEALKKSVAQDQVRLKQYEWIETTVISLKGEEKSRKQDRCYYGADGGLQKVPVVAAPESKKRGLRGRIAENKKEELTEYMQQAVGLVKLYVPPTPERIQASKNAGKVSLTPQPGKGARLDFRDFVKPGDMLSVDVDPANSRLLGIKVATYLADAKDVVNLVVGFGVLADGTGYPASTTLEAKSKGLVVVIQNSGYRKAGS